MLTIDKQKNKHTLEFTGDGMEFFKIWIVNVMLSIVTVGFYSPWAKVRTKRYFYGNTLLMGTAFDYLADPIKILKGRLVALLLLIIYSIGGISPVIQGLLTLIFIPLLPWIIIKALRFNAYNSAYRNIRFTFHARYLTALGVFVGMPFLVGITAGLAYPFFVRARKKFVLDHTAYGTSNFELQASGGEFYAIYLKASVMMLALVGIFVGIGYSLGGNYHLSHSDFAAVMMIAPLLLLPFAVLIFAYIYTATTNLVINKTVIEKHHFESSLEVGKMCWLYFSNMLMIIFSLGLLIPWAMVRTAAYRISCMSVYVEGNVDDFIAAETERAEAIGEEIGDIFDLDIGL
jgi:uncharacterized membrane protein YjgN (DUF898 family)